jgi:hypothetical protein
VTNPVSEWILKAAQFEEPLVQAASGAEILPIKINWLLLGCALKQGIELAELQNFLTELQKEISDIAELPVPSENLILSIISKCRLKNWSLAPQVAGIIWSVGRFARARENRLDLWAKNHSPSVLWQQSGEIFYMGKSNPLRPKVLGFLFRLSFLSNTGEGVLPPLPNSAGARRWLIRSGIYNSEQSPKEKLRDANSLYKELFPKNPSLACHALQFFAEPVNESIYFCQRIFLCNLCPVGNFCKRNTYP